MNKYRISVDSVQIKGSSKGNLAALSSENVISEYCECDHTACKEYEADTIEQSKEIFKRECDRATRGVTDGYPKGYVLVSDVVELTEIKLDEDGEEYDVDTLEIYAPEGKKALWKENKYELTDITAAMGFEPNEEQEAVLIHETKDSDHSGDYILIGHCADFYFYDEEYTEEDFEDLIKNSSVCTDYSFDKEREIYICR